MTTTKIADMMGHMVHFKNKDGHKLKGMTFFIESMYWTMLSDRDTRDVAIFVLRGLPHGIVWEVPWARLLGWYNEKLLTLGMSRAEKFGSWREAAMCYYPATVGLWGQHPTVTASSSYGGALRSPIKSNAAPQQVIVTPTALEPGTAVVASNAAIIT